ncbi:hypothetical protein PGT21_007228 [Puccinia graminis f. sp. tritici]|uniref:Uncharacterized protein n=1 Tax=Puccinia graminis f. sp. tritici TaxID=56615 RepID=A0A5B0P0Q2_PUCGR|nr:hypothetical protein PGT21_007228 [Puccinia graminis f. sp. tritici]KAA1093658.1 hypothetical protein PGTUg99_017416 [Puccinia graminis f. sp. tritici]
MLSAPIHPNYIFPAPPTTRTKRSASIHDHHRSKRLQQPNDSKRRTAILSFPSHSGKAAVDWAASGKKILSRKKESQQPDNSYHQPNRRSLYTRLYAKLKAATCTSGTSSKLTFEELDASQVIINRNPSCTSHGSVNSPGNHPSFQRRQNRKPLVMKVYNSQILYVAECCVHCNHRCENKPDNRLQAHDEPEIYGLRTPTAQKSVQTFDQLSPSPSAITNPERKIRPQSPPPIPWRTRPIPTRPFRPSGEYDEEIVELNVSNRLPGPLPSYTSPNIINNNSMIPPFARSNDEFARDLQTISSSFHDRLQAQEWRKSDGYTTPRTNRLCSTFSEPTTTTASPALSTSQRLEDILGNHPDYSLPTGESYIFSSSNSRRQDLSNDHHHTKTFARVTSLPGRTDIIEPTDSFKTRSFQVGLPLSHRLIQSWNSLPHLLSQNRRGSTC